MNQKNYFRFIVDTNAWVFFWVCGVWVIHSLNDDPKMLCEMEWFLGKWEQPSEDAN